MDPGESASLATRNAPCKTTDTSKAVLHADKKIYPATLARDIVCGSCLLVELIHGDIAMRRKIVWITLGMTMAFWFGCAGQGGEQNYKELENGPREPVMQPERSIGGPNPADPRGDATSTESQPYRETSAPISTPPVAANTSSESSSDMPVADQSTVQPINSSANGTTVASSNVLDRSDWPRITVTPNASGLRTHPTYFSDGVSEVNARTLDTTADTDTQLTAALDGAHSTTLNKADIENLYLLPLEFSRDLVLMPLRATQTLPWELQPAHVSTTTATEVDQGAANDISTTHPEAQP